MVHQNMIQYITVQYHILLFSCYSQQLGSLLLRGIIPLFRNGVHGARVVEHRPFSAEPRFVGFELSEALLAERVPGEDDPEHDVYK